MLDRWRGISLQRFAWGALILTIFALAIAFSSQVSHQQAIRELVGERDERAARAAASVIADQLNSRAASVRTLALQAAAGQSVETLLAEPADEFEGGKAIIAPDGTLLALSPELESRREWLASGSWQKPINTPEDTWFGPIIQNENGEPLVLVGAEAEGGFVALGAFDPADLAHQALTGIFEVNERTHAFVVDGDYRVLYQMGDPPGQGAETQPHPGVMEALQGQSGATFVSDSESEHVVAFSPIEPVKWALVLEEPWQVVVDPWLRVTEFAPFLLAPALIITLIGVWFAVYQVVRPLNALQRKATRLAWGDYEAIDESVGGIIEIRQLQGELAFMAGKVRTSQKGLRNYLRATTRGQEEERLRLARELHDDTLQSLIALNQRVQLAQLKLNGHPASTQLADVQVMSDQLVGNLRRITHALRPAYLEELGLAPALETLAQDTQKAAGFPVEFMVEGGQRRLDPEVELTLYRMAQEALNNIVRHAHAGQAAVFLAFKAEETRLTVTDDGRGFDVPESPAEMAPNGHLGILGLFERAELINARLAITSAADQGTKVVVTVPG